MKPSDSLDSSVDLLRAAGGTLWWAVRVPLLGILTLLEPVVRVVFGLAMVLGIFAAVMLELSAAGPRFPFLGMLAVSLCFGAALFAYYGLLALLSR